MSIFVLGFTVAGSFLVTFVVLPRLIRLAENRNLCDEGSGDSLKVHSGRVPIIGGAAMACGFLAALAIVEILYDVPGYVWGIACVAILVLALGLWDDLRNLRPVLRLAGHTAAAAITLAVGISTEAIPSGILTVALTAVFVVGSINAVNLFDGLDGLAGGVVGISLMGFGVLFVLQGKVILAATSLALLGAVAGFLPSNFHPAIVFMGDNGSTFLGYCLAALAVLALQSHHDVRHVAASIMMIGLPLLDTAVAIIRRLLQRRPVLMGDRGHVYDRLMGAGFSVRGAVLTCYVMQSLLVATAVLIAGKAQLSP